MFNELAGFTYKVLDQYVQYQHYLEHLDIQSVPFQDCPPPPPTENTNIDTTRWVIYIHMFVNRYTESAITHVDISMVLLAEVFGCN